MPRLQVVASDEAAEFLGGPLPSGVDRVPFPDPVFDRLSRPPSTKLPPLHSKDRQFLLSDDGFEDVFMKIFNGDGFWIEWEASEESPEWDYEIKISAFGSERLVNTPRGLEQFEGPILKSTIRGGVDKPSAYSLERKGSNHSFGNLPHRKSNALFYRAIHLFVRTVGNSIDGDVLNVVSAYLLTQYRKDKWWKEAIDLCVTLTDIVLQKSPADNDLLRWWMYKLGEMQEAKRNFSIAGDIYRFCTYLAPEEKRPVVLNSCGLAYKRAGRYDEAEEHLIRALHIESTTTAEPVWDINGIGSGKFLVHLMLMYERWTEHEVGKGNGGGDQIVLPEIAVIEAAFVSMLFAVGFKGNNGVPRNTLKRIEVNGGYLQKYLNNKMKSRVKAIKSLKNLFSTGDSKHLRSSLLSYCKNARMVRRDDLFRRCVLERIEEHSSEDHLAQVVDTARDHAGDIGESYGSSDLACANPACNGRGEEGKFKKCPCRNTFYCDKECQVTHWPEHKLVCPVAVAKKQKKQARGRCKSKK